MSTTTRLVLIRHGESRAQTEGIVAGHSTCTGLSPWGRRQADALRHRLTVSQELGAVGAVYASLQARSMETADIVGPALGENPPVSQECDWCELHPGAAEGMTWDELRQRHPIAGDPDDPHRRRVAGAETWAELYRRIGDRMACVTQDHPGERVVVFCHGGPVGASLVSQAEVPVERGVGFVRRVANTSITEWHHNGRTWRLVRFNDAEHLADLPPGPSTPRKSSRGRAD